MTTRANTVEGGNEALNSALVIAQQISLLLPTVGALATAGTLLVQRLMAARNADQATVEQAREAINNLRTAAQELQSVTAQWLAEHPPETP